MTIAPPGDAPEESGEEALMSFDKMCSAVRMGQLYLGVYITHPKVDPSPDSLYTLVDLNQPCLYL